MKHASLIVILLLIAAASHAIAGGGKTEPPQIMRGAGAALPAASPESSPRTGSTPDNTLQNPQRPEPLWVSGDILVAGNSAIERKPSIACDTNGILYCAYEVLDPGGTQIHISRSTDGGANWAFWQMTWSSAGLTEPSIAVGQGSGEERLIVAHVKGGYEVQVTWWTLDGFEAYGVTIETNYDGVSNPKVVTDASEQSDWMPYVVYNSRGADSWLLRFSRSRDYGETWSRSFTLHDYAETPYYDATNAYPDIEFGSGVLYVAFDDYVGGTAQRDIYFMSSEDFGATWSASAVISTSSRDEFAPVLAAVKDYFENKTVVACYTRAYSLYDWDLWYAYTQDGGGTWYGNYCLACDSYKMELMCDFATSFSRGNIHVAFFEDGTTKYSNSTHDNPGVFSSATDASDPGVTNENWPRPAVTVNPTQPLAMEAGIAWTDDRGASLDIYYDGPATEDSGVETEDPVSDPALFIRCQPNPFRVSTAISFGVAARTSAQVGVYDVSGRRIRNLVESAVLPPGECNLRWDGRDDSGRDVGPGAYFIRVSVPGRSAQSKVVMLR